MAFCWLRFLHCCKYIPSLALQMDVSKNSGPQNGWFIMVPNPIRMDDLGGFPIFLETPKYSWYNFVQSSLAQTTSWNTLGLIKLVAFFW